MGKAQKKYGKGRLDHYYRLAKEKGYRARSSFKIVQLNQKYGFFNLPKGTKPRPMCIIDLCAAPGSWCQVATQQCPLNSLIVGVDLAPIKPLPNVITFQSDITTEHCRSQLRGYLKTWKADVVMHDGAPNVGMAWAQDAFTQSELVLQSLKLAVEFLTPGGWFVTKVFRSKDYNKLMWVFQQFFEKCEATKPPSSRNVSAEIFVVCKNFKAPKQIDPRLLDPKYVFEELQEKNNNNQAKIYNPEKKTRKREGYEEGEYLQFKRISALDFVRTEDPITCLGETNVLEWDKSDPEIKQLKKLPQTTPDLLELFKDLKVLGKKDFRVILKWRVAARKLLGIDKEESESEPEVVLTTEEQIEKEMDELKANAAARQKREKRRRNEAKQKEIMRMQLNMVTPMEIGIDAGNQKDSLFDLNSVKKTGYATDLVKGKQQAPVLANTGDRDFDFGDEKLDALDELPDSDSEADEDDVMEIDSDDDGAQLESQLDAMYRQFKETQALSAEAQAKKARESEVWDGIQSASEASDMDSDSDFDSDIETENLSGKANMFFDDDAFKKIDVASDSEDGDTEDEETTSNTEPEPTEPAVDGESSDEEHYDPTKEEDMQERAIKMTLAHKLALGQITKHDLINDGYNKYSFRDTDGLPEWFLEDEGKHSKRIKPVTKEAAAAIKEQMKVLNARPIKKVAEATARKRMRAQKRLEKIRKKSDLINDDASKSEREKAEDIAKLMRRAKSKKKPKVTVVAAKGSNRGLQGRPKGVKGKYKMVDGVMKKEQRALKRVAKKQKR
ncbi:AdoMet-dependent rRNA methyltransferase SPB1 [Wickerhamiella sorbophila]|uniref:AdoMet-dependent rRNA methyltransferase SPB1 n=1 Tax=Wickerhamiella sorbophila TaxID=45607 RepID=A0A2T0FDW9_9ASCO|nr:AdoMet-dependent rRNA methyltransferase SPB1 [Wickerhamiella sorbophila]PRT53160.1 AdoMet-dependent rRNA methyltransferase SPB1 [Wickerhamiella sorbophila]